MPGGSAKQHHNLPAHRVRLIGRELDLAAAQQALLTTEGRLLTLTGTGGCGKTRLALEMASSLLEVFPDGVWLVELSPLSDPSLVPLTVISVLGLHEQHGEPALQTLVAWISGRRLLLLLDNCEHLVDTCAQFAEALLDACPNLRLLATSREPLRITAELTWRVPSLAVPDLQASPAELLRTPAVQLFLERAQAVQADFPAAGRARTVAQICIQLDGLPLAIELAAARVRTLGVEDILSHLDDSIRLLVGGRRTAPTRQQTLRATLDWSYGLLSTEERAVFGCMAVFAGDCSLDAAEAVCADDGVAPSDVLDLLERLVDKSLVVMQERDGHARFRLLEPVRQYAHERLSADGELNLVRRRHALYYVAYGDARHNETNRGGARRQAATAELGREYSNVRTALAWCVDAGESQLGLLLAGSLLFLWQIQGSANEGFGWLGQLFELPGAEAPTAARARALVAAAHLAWVRGDFNAGRSFCQEALPLTRRLADRLLEYLALLFTSNHAQSLLDLPTAVHAAQEALACARAAADRVGEGQALQVLAQHACDRADYPAGETLAAEALRLARIEEDGWNEGWALMANGRVALGVGDYQQAQTFLEAGLAVARQQGEPSFLTAWTLCRLGEVGIASGQLDRAREWLLNSFELAHKDGERYAMALTLDRLAALEAMSARFARALSLTGVADALYARLVPPRGLSDHDTLERWLPAARNRLGTAAADRAWADGQAMALKDVVAFIRESKESSLSARVPTVPDSASLAGLTAREQEVAALLAHGLTNRQIAERLVVTERTAAAHVEHILDKLGFASRHQVGAWAAEHGPSA